MANDQGEFDTTLKKQTGGAGQYARVAGYLEPVRDEDGGFVPSEFEDATLGGTIPPEYMEACRKGFLDSIEKVTDTQSWKPCRSRVVGLLFCLAYFLTSK